MLPTCLPIIRAMNLAWRPLTDVWARRQLQIAIRVDADAAIVALRDFLCAPSQKNEGCLAQAQIDRRGRPRQTGRP